jgi:hypothetical protein
MEKVMTEGIRSEWKLRKVNNVPPKWYTHECGAFCSQCATAYDFNDAYKALLLSRAKGQTRGPRCIVCGKILRTRSKPNPFSGFWDKVEKLEIEEEPKKNRECKINVNFGNIR